jgi:choline kinase
MIAVILAAGTGTRLRPLTENKPKCLLNVGEKNILQRTLENVIANDINEFVIVTGYLEQQIKDFVSANFPDILVSYIYNEAYAVTNNIYSLWLAKDHLLGCDIILLDSDIVFDKQIITKLMNAGYENCLALKRHKVGEEEIKVKADKEGKVLEISKIVTPKHAIGESIGIEIFSTETLFKLYEVMHTMIVEESNVNIFYEAAFEKMIQQGEEIYVVDVTEYACMEIDTAEDLQNAGELMF